MFIKGLGGVNWTGKDRTYLSKMETQQHFLFKRVWQVGEVGGLTVKETGRGNRISFPGGINRVIHPLINWWGGRGSPRK